MRAPQYGVSIYKGRQRGQNPFSKPYAEPKRKVIGRSQTLARKPLARGRVAVSQKPYTAPKLSARQCERKPRYGAPRTALGRAWLGWQNTAPLPSASARGYSKPVEAAMKAVQGGYRAPYKAQPTKWRLWQATAEKKGWVNILWGEWPMVTGRHNPKVRSLKRAITKSGLKNPICSRHSNLNKR